MKIEVLDEGLGRIRYTEELHSLPAYVGRTTVRSTDKKLSRNQCELKSTSCGNVVVRRGPRPSWIQVGVNGPEELRKDEERDLPDGTILWLAKRPEGLGGMEGRQPHYPIRLRFQHLPDAATFNSCISASSAAAIVTDDTEITTTGAESQAISSACTASGSAKTTSLLPAHTSDSLEDAPDTNNGSGGSMPVKCTDVRVEAARPVPPCRGRSNRLSSRVNLPPYVCCMKAEDK